MSQKYLITLSDEQSQALETLMSSELSSNRSAFIGSLIGAKYKEHQAEMNRKPLGRPRKSESPSVLSDGGSEYEDAADYSRDVPKNINHFGRMIGRREFEDIKRTSEDFGPKL